MRNEIPELLKLAPDGSGWLVDSQPWIPTRELWAVVGFPVAHSLSPVFQNIALRELGIDADYVRLEISPELWPLFIERAWGLGLKGCNVTAPFKEMACEACRQLSDTALAVGAVNTMSFADDGPSGHNTDVGGLVEVLTTEGVDDRRQGLILGAGGAARAAVTALQRCGVSKITVMARQGASLSSFQQWFAQASIADIVLGVVDWAPFTTADPKPLIAVSAVSSGVAVEPILPEGDAESDHVLVDLRYGRSCPTFDHPGWRIRDGAALLLAQGLHSLRWWFDREPPAELLYEALASTLADDKR